MYLKAISILLIACLLNLLIACSGITNSDQGVAIGTRDDLQNHPSDNTDCIPCTMAGNYQAFNPVFSLYDDGGSGEIDKALNHPEVQYTIAHFTDKGYAFDAPNSFVIETSVLIEEYPDTLDMRVVNLTMRYLPDSTNSFVQITVMTCTNISESPTIINSSLASFVFPGSDADSFEEFSLGFDDEGVEQYIWIKDYISPFEYPTDPGYFVSKTTWFKWKSWLSCTVGVIVVGCVRSAYMCSASGPGYAACVGTGCGVSALAGMAGCAAAQVIDHYLE